VYTSVDIWCVPTSVWGSTFVQESQNMPGQRHPNKKQLTVWRHEKDMDVLREVAKQNDISMSELMEVLIEDFQDKKKADQVKYLRNKRKDQT
jgi:hypothetical protein